MDIFLYAQGVEAVLTESTPRIVTGVGRNYAGLRGTSARYSILSSKQIGNSPIFLYRTNMK